MLQLTPYNMELNQLINRLNHGYDANFIHVDGLEHASDIFNGRRIYSKSCGCPDLPYIFNFKNYSQDSISLMRNEESSLPDVQVLNNILNAYIEKVATTEECIIYLRLYSYNLNVLDVCDNIDQFIKHNEDQVSVTYNKCIQDCKERNELTREIGALVYSHKEYNLVIEVVNFDDSVQGSDYFLTLGMLPALCPKIKEKLDDKELKYLKEFIRRSQVKRIRNVEVENYYRDMCTLDKYMKRIKELQFKATIDTILRNRKNSARNAVDMCDAQRRNLLEQYESTLRDLDKYKMELDRLEHGEDKVAEDIYMVSDLKGVHSINANGSRLTIRVRTELEYYDPEIAEMVLEKKQDTYAVALLKEIFVKQKYKMFVGQNFNFSYNPQDNLQLPSNISYTSTPRELSCLFNPHLEFYRCYGDNEPYLVKAHKEKDIVNFVNSALVSVKNVNFADSAVINKWIETLTDLIDHDNYDTNYLNIKALQSVETGEMYSIADWMDIKQHEEYERIQRERERLEAEFVENAEELEPREIGVAPELNEQFIEDEEDDL